MAQNDNEKRQTKGRGRRGGGVDGRNLGASDGRKRMMIQSPIPMRGHSSSTSIDKGTDPRGRGEEH